MAMSVMESVTTSLPVVVSSLSAPLRLSWRLYLSISCWRSLICLSISSRMLDLSPVEANSLPVTELPLQDSGIS